LWRRLYVLDLAAESLRVVSPEGINFWEAEWMGDEHVVTVTSDSHGEGSWYRSTLQRLSVADGKLQELYAPADQIGVPAADTTGRRLALIEAVCSDRKIVAGKLLLLDVTTGAMRTVDTNSVDVTHLEWRNSEHLLYSGVRGFDTVVGEVDWSTGKSQEYWKGWERTLGDWHPTFAAHPRAGVVAVSESYDMPPQIVFIRDGDCRIVRPLASPQTQKKEFSAARIEPYRWNARDGLEMHGWLIRPPGKGPFPLVMDIHGGPVWCCRNRWQGRLRGAKVLADHGVASLYPNPRGSSGRGLEFARLVKGDMGGEDTYDYLTGIDALVAAGIADPKRLGVTGISYGGFMSAWLITQDARFAAAAPISCVSDWYSQHRTSQIPFFDQIFLNADPAAGGGHFFDRSPVMFADRVRTPTFQITGAQDQNTPPTQALEFHRSLLETGVRSVLATYPTAGHGIRGFPEVMDATTRYVGWMLEHLTK
jgi:dipeptidyl aminopeptidase/acylaminoacyl peptidase